MPSEPARLDRIEEIVAAYLDETGAGRPPDRTRLINDNPDLADDLRGVFRTLDLVESTGRSLTALRLEPGQTLGEYRIVRLVGRGGMGVVYEAVQTSLDRRVALKILASPDLLGDHARERFREASTAARLHHSNIVPVYAIGEDSGLLYYAMQFIEGRTLSSHLREMAGSDEHPGRGWYRRVAGWGRQVSDALAYAHEQDIIHRDIKPSNLLLDAGDNVWVSDFGLARAGSNASITASNGIVGTARYMSPEQARGGHAGLDERTDIYSLGATLYELATLRPVFDDGSRRILINRAAVSDPLPPRRVDPAIPRDLETIILTSMDRNVDRRYRRASMLAEDCRRFMMREPIRAKRPSVLVKTVRRVNRHRVGVAATALVILLLTVTVVLGLEMRRRAGIVSLEQAYTTLLFERDVERAAVLLDEAEARGIDNADLDLARGLVPLFAEEPQAALGPLQHALGRHADHVETTLALTYAYYSMADVLNSNRLFDRVDEAEIDSALGWLLHGHVLALREDPNAAASYDRALTLRSDFIPAIEARARCRGDELLVRGSREQLEPMLDDLDALVILRPGSARAYAERARGLILAAACAGAEPQLRQQRGVWLDRAGADLDEALRRRSDHNWRIVALHGGYLRFVDDFEGAAAAFAEADAIHRRTSESGHPGLLHQRALCLHALDRTGEALAEVDAAWTQWPKLFPIPLQRALLLAEEGRLPEARAACATRLDPADASAITFTMAVAFAELLGDHATAEAGLARFERTVAADVDAGQGPLEPALDYLAGRCDALTMLAAAGEHPARRCEFAFLAGLCELGRGRRGEGLRYLRICLDSGVFTYTQHRFAHVMLTRADADPQWPRWTTRESHPVRR